MAKRTSEVAFETAIEAMPLADGYSKLSSGDFGRERAIFPAEALAFIRETQANTWEKPSVLPGEQIAGAEYPAPQPFNDQSPPSVLAKT